ncbi:hypothetical protein [Sphingobium sp. CFD-1]|uniref:hypothetical protein n=1 Tax=Sphingobium sp. CFD-1 TaxID=2878545 RepID=UPI00214B1A34|nr:hypothetical protein [Sphingobium sp. CFD-1]
MGYFSNATEGDFWEAENCAHCVHNKPGQDDPMCPVMLAHMTYAYELCNAESHPGKVILDWLIPRNKSGVGNARCAMLVRKNAVSDKHLKDWTRYKAAMAEMEQSQ